MITQPLSVGIPQLITPHIDGRILLLQYSSLWEESIRQASQAGNRENKERYMELGFYEARGWVMVSVHIQRWELAWIQSLLPRGREPYGFLITSYRCGAQWEGEVRLENHPESE